MDREHKPGHRRLMGKDSRPHIGIIATRTLAVTLLLGGLAIPLRPIYAISSAHPEAATGQNKYLYSVARMFFRPGAFAVWMLSNKSGITPHSLLTDTPTDTPSDTPT